MDVIERLKRQHEEVRDVVNVHNVVTLPKLQHTEVQERLCEESQCLQEIGPCPPLRNLAPLNPKHAYTARVVDSALAGAPQRDNVHVIATFGERFRITDDTVVFLVE